MSANPSTTDFASVNGTILSDMVIDQRIRSGRGKRLTLAQETVLKRLYELELSLLPEGETPVKRFWVNLASRFQKCTGREYSWLSVRRKLTKSGDEGQRPNCSQPSECIAQVGDESPVVEPVRSNASNDTPRQQVPRNVFQLSRKQDQAIDPQGPNCSAYSELERSPPVVGKWTRRVLFPDAIGLSQQAHTISGLPQVSDSCRPLQSRSSEFQPARSRCLRTSSERTEVVSRRLHCQLDTASDEDHLPDPTNLPSLSPPAASYGHNGTTFASSKRKYSALNRDPTLLGELLSRQSPSPHRLASKSPGELCHLSDSDGLPEPPAQISRKPRISRKKGTC